MFLHYRMREYSAASWRTAEAIHLLMLDDDQPENEKVRLDPDHWYENNLTNAILFANLSLEGLHQLVPGNLTNFFLLKINMYLVHLNYITIFTL